MRLLYFFKNVFKLQQKTEIIICEECRRCIKRTATMFNERRHNSSLNYKYILEWVAKFTDSVAYKKKHNGRVLDQAA